MPDLLPENNQPKIDTSVYGAPIIHKKKSRLLRWSVVGLVLAILVFGLAFLTKFVSAINSTNDASGKKVGLFEQIKHLVVNPTQEIKGETADRINILLMGYGGAGHDGAYLTDTIILASIKPSTSEVALISIPRDLYVDIPEYGWRKINNSFAFGRESDYPGGGAGLLSKVVADITGLPIHYYASIDFTGFKKAVDDVGGIDVTVDNTFTDYQYPDYNYGIQTITFTKGLEHMDGERALQFVRSRHGNNGEGSDFARSARQQKVLFALKDKFLSLNSIINPASIVNALNDLGKHNETNMQVWEMVQLAQITKDVNKNEIINQVLDTGTDGLLYSATTPDGAYILKPTAGDFSDIQYMAKNIFNSALVAREQAKIEVQNSTAETGLAAKTAERLKAMKYDVVTINNSRSPEELTQTTIYDLSGGSKPYTLSSLKNILNANITSNLPAFLTQQPINYLYTSNDNASASQTDIDILIIIGNDLKSKTQVTSRSAAKQTL